MTTAEDRFVDYCLWEYVPSVPFVGKLRSSNLLWHSLAATGADPRIAAVCDSLRNALGDGRTVWGVKQAAGRLSWELYFYDYDRLERRRSVGRVLDAIRPHLRCDLTYPDARPYFMFSIELDEAVLSRGRLEEIDIYIGNVGSAVSSGICYGLTSAGLALHNFYFFFDALRERDAAMAKLACSAHLDLAGLDPAAVLWPELVDCRVIVVANKRRNDGIYFSGIGVDQLLFFLRRTGYPATLISYIAENRDALNHLRYDVGYDYAMRDGEIRVLKASYYGFI